MKEQKRIHEGLITELRLNGICIFRVRLDNENLILGFASGKVKRNFIHIPPVNRIKILVSYYDSTKRNRICIFSIFKSKDSKNWVVF
uniref:Translation initiation factor 1 n=1 Tax=Farinopsis salesoviana TaxID=210861 RepID=A0A1V0J800_9ROSA|nr:translation initiation factor 1 [Comarum salesovianum]